MYICSIRDFVDSSQEYEQGLQELRMQISAEESRLLFSFVILLFVDNLQHSNLLCSIRRKNCRHNAAVFTFDNILVIKFIYAVTCLTDLLTVQYKTHTAISIPMVLRNCQGKVKCNYGTSVRNTHCD